jgi:hypothetical protein
MASDFVAALKQEYIDSLKAEQKAKDESIKADERHDRARAYRTLTERLLQTKGIDPSSLVHPKESRKSEGIEQFGLVPSNNGMLPTKPVNSTHLVYLLMRQHGNAGFTAAELEAFGREVGYDLPEKEVMRVFWKQNTAKRMEKTTDGKLKLTKEGEKFNKFRVQKIGDEYKPMIQNFPAEVIK